MSDPLKTAFPRKTALFAGAIALSFGLFAASAHAGPAVSGLDGLKSPGIEAQTVASRTYKKRRIYIGQNNQPSYPSNPDYAKEPYMPFGGSDEILELQRRFPQTNWPQSMRYFPNTP
ncbi:MAG: hypothetical protein ACRECX_02645 [Methyloceanibacter sp.]|uniref:hypothetical protein n=1 Tax=Methyloceanibacter sp. TaxID=1965321 RepID=UPI003D6D09DD